ncbi:MAG: hypothetical protein D3916_13010 [Candidatus Electrothrix sp. MAN1_4]|nr:hypothetical protein [Candidatus Electrothrix sp. MAN1_4]
MGLLSTRRIAPGWMEPNRVAPQHDKQCAGSPCQQGIEKGPCLGQPAGKGFLPFFVQGKFDIGGIIVLQDDAPQLDQADIIGVGNVPGLFKGMRGRELLGKETAYRHLAGITCFPK